MTPASIAAAVWGESVRTLASGTPAAPVTTVDGIVAAIWTHNVRTLTHYPALSFAGLMARGGSAGVLQDAGPIGLITRAGFAGTLNHEGGLGV